METTFTTSTFTGEPKWYSIATDRDYTRLKIEKQEKKDAYIVTRMLEDNIRHNRNISCFLVDQTKMGTHYDLISSFLCGGKRYQFAYEIKERNKTEDQPYSELKDQKLKAILDSTRGYDAAFYISIVNGKTAYMWNLNKINWDTQESFIWHIKKTQFSRSDQMEDALTYKLYWADAVLKVDVTKYIEDYNRLQN